MHKQLQLAVVKTDRPPLLVGLLSGYVLMHLNISQVDHCIRVFKREAQNEAQNGYVNEFIS